MKIGLMLREACAIEGRDLDEISLSAGLFVRRGSGQRAGARCQGGEGGR